MYFNILIPQPAMDKTKFFMDESYFLMHSCYTGKPRVKRIFPRILIDFFLFPQVLPLQSILQILITPETGAKQKKSPAAFAAAGDSICSV